MAGNNGRNVANAVLIVIDGESDYNAAFVSLTWSGLGGCEQS